MKTDPLLPDQQAVDDAIREILRNSQGRRFLWWVLKQCAIYQPMLSDFEQGSRNVGLKIIAGISDVDPSAYANLLLEAVKESTPLKDE